MSAGKNGWPTSKIAPDAPKTEDEQAALIDTIEDWKTQRYQELIGRQACGMHTTSHSVHLFWCGIQADRDEECLHEYFGHQWRALAPFWCIKMDEPCNLSSGMVQLLAPHSILPVICSVCVMVQVSTSRPRSISLPLHRQRQGQASAKCRPPYGRGEG